MSAGIVAHDFLRDALRVALRLGGRDARLQTAHHLVAPVSRRCGGKLLRREAHGNPQLGAVQLPGVQWEFEIARHHADDEIGLSIQQDLGVQNLGVAMEAGLPGGIAEHHDLLAVLVLVGGEHPPQLGCDASAENTPAVKRAALTCAGSPLPDSS